MIKYLLITSLACLTIAVYAFDGAVALDIVTTISSDEFEGRRPGFKGATKAEDFLANKLQEFGLAPSGKDGFFQQVPMLVTEQQSAQLTLMNHELGKIQFHQGTDFSVVTNSGSGSMVANVIVVGHGISRTDKNWDDYAGTDVKGKVVLIIRGTPESPWDFSEDFPRRHSLRWAKERGATGILWYAGSSLVHGAAIPEASYDSELPMVYVGDRVVNTLLDGSGYNLETYKEKLKSGPLPLDVKKELWLNIKVKKLTNPVCRNVIGIVYGTDPVLKNELIVLGAHMDHVGKNSDGAIYNGADDNASGTGLVCELGRAIAQSPLKRSVLVCLFTGEEDGLLGSAHFCEQPTVPFGNISAMLNFDMEGQGNGKVGIQGGELLGLVWQDYLATLDSSARAQINLSRSDGSGASDHSSFLEAGAPALAFWSSGSHPFYHKYTDESPWISKDVLQAVGDRAENVLRFLGNRSEALAFRADSLRLLARHTESIDLKGAGIETKIVLPESRVPVSAWLPSDPKALAAELIRRTTEFEYLCKQRNIAADGLAGAVSAHWSQKPGAFIGIQEAGIVGRKPYEVESLVKLGLSVVQLARGDTKKMAPNEAESLQAARSAGAYALMPLDFLTPARVEEWGNHSIVQTTLGELLAMPADAREGLLRSEALVFCDVHTPPAIEQVDLIRPFTGRRVHLNINERRDVNREAVALEVVTALYEAACSRDQILQITGGNLRRFLATGSAHKGHVHD